MAKKNIFDNDDTSEYEQLAESISEVQEDDVFDEILNEVEERPVSQAKARQVAKANIAYKLNSQETDIMSTAIQRLEQARLYDMFLKHNLFDGVQADASAKKAIEKELKTFILERLQILLGIKQEKSVQQSVVVQNQFNDIEADFLKQLAEKGTKGESRRAEPQMVRHQPTPMKAMGMQPMGQLKSMGSAPQEVVEEYEEEIEEAEPLRTTPKQAPQRSAKPAAPKQVKSRVTTAEDLAREDLKRMANRKSAYEMTDKELLEQSKKIKNNKAGKSSQALPMPSADHMQMHYMNQAVVNQQALNTPGLVGLLSQKMGFSTTQIQHMGDDDE